MSTYKRHRSPPDIISYAVWLYYRFNLSHRDIDDLLAERGITIQGFLDFWHSGIQEFRNSKVCTDPPTPVYGSVPRVGRSKNYNSMIYIKNGGP